MEREIEIRSIDGESASVSIAPDRSIGDLKAILKESFLPALSSPNFHLYLRGTKLSPETRIDIHSLGTGDFVVLVPFAKKIRQLPSLDDTTQKNNISSQCSYGSASASAAESAWLDMMDDVSYLSSISKHDTEPSTFGSSNNPRQGKCEEHTRESSNTFSLNRNHMKESDNDSILVDILCSNSKDEFDEQTCDKIRQVVESANCLSHSERGSCLLFEEFFRKSQELDRCICPPWLKRVLKSFTFLNLFYAFLLVQGKCMTRNCLEEALKQPRYLGLDDTCISDVEKLSILCPKVVVLLSGQETTTGKLGSAIIISSSSTEVGYQCGSTNQRRTAKKQVSTSAVMNAIKRRGFSFSNTLWKAIKLCMGKKLLEMSIPPMLSLEDLIMSINLGTGLMKGSQVKAMKTRSLASGCQGVNQLEPAEMVEHLREGIGTYGQIVHVEEIFAKLAVHAELPNGLSEISKATIKGMGISRLYSHQDEAIQASLSGKNVVVATSTSSGKSLCYNLPVLEALSQNPSSCALYVFPTKALAQDQLRALLELTRGLDIGLTVGVYDGDTSQGHRSWIRDDARLVITNPDMLHMSILPYHRQFERILSNLRFIVIDEAHTYKGAFGCHTAFILRRLRRICFHVYGTEPSFIFSTATSANPREHAMELANLETLELIQKDGSPCGPKYFLLWNPPLRSESKPTRRIGQLSANGDSSTRRTSSIMEASYLFAEMVQHGLRCIMFCKTRKLTELVLYHTREILHRTAPDLVDTICVYRGGYTPQDRRRIETDLFGGKLRGVAATNALELGIDVGHIDATLHLGFPGSVASLWQQAGRSGRRSRPSLAIYIAFEGPLDQYFMKFPHKLFQRPIELCHVDAQNHKVLQQHITCAALELPLCPQYDEKYFGAGLHSAIASLKNKGYLANDPSRVSSTKIWSYIGPEEKPSNTVSVRAIENVKYKVVDQSSSEVLEEIEESRAFFQIYEGAVYMNQGATYLVKALVLAEKTAFCEKADLKYYTKTRDYTDIHVIGGDLAYPPMKPSQFEYLRTTAQTNNCKVTTKWFGFYRIWRANNRIFDKVELVLPAYSYESQATWIRVPQSIKTAVEMEEISFRAGLHAASHALLNAVPLYIMCNASDLSTECANPHENRDIPERLLLYDKHPGGIGISAQIQLLFTELLISATELVSTCSCLADEGCPSCVQILSCSEHNEVLNKKAALIILEGLIESERKYQT